MSLQYIGHTEREIARLEAETSDWSKFEPEIIHALLSRLGLLRRQLAKYKAGDHERTG